MKICAFVQTKFYKRTYKKDSLDHRQFAGLKIIIDVLERAGFDVDFATSRTVHEYDVVLVSLTSDSDWYSYIQERQTWRPGQYTTVVGGAGVMNIRPFLDYGDYFVFGRGEDIVLDLIASIDSGAIFEHDSVAHKSNFDVERIYCVAQASRSYPHVVKIDERTNYDEGKIGCNHRCYFCQYTWVRKQNFIGSFEWDSADGRADMVNKERAMLDFGKPDCEIDFRYLRMTAIDGFSERLRFSVNKKITDEIVFNFLRAMIESDAKPHRMKLFNLVGLPTETEEDWWKLIEVFRRTEDLSNEYDGQWGIELHSTPFRAMPATPMACAPMSYKNYRGLIASTLGAEHPGHYIYRGKNLWARETSWTESLPTVILSALVHRGVETDARFIDKLCRTRKFWSASVPVKLATLEANLDVHNLFRAYAPDELPTRYLRSYASHEKLFKRWSPKN